jgi:lipid-A-disaccharide synthase
LKVFISAAEASSDTHAAEVVKRLKALASSKGIPFHAFGIAGPKLRAEGVEARLPAENFLAMGFVEVLKRIPRLRQDLESITADCERERPDLAVLCDYPEFHMRLAERLKALGIPVICYIPPKIWVWRKGRIKKLERLYDRVLSILPFERETYAGSGVAYEYVGNPLVDELPLTLSREEARRSVGLRDDAPAVLLMVGSRPSEFKYHLQPMIEAALLLKTKREEAGEVVPSFLLPLPGTANLSDFEARLGVLRKELSGAEALSIRVSQGDAWVAMKAADAGIIKSGTSSLEAALLGCPHVVVYQAHPVSRFIFKHVVRYRKPISLTNLILPGAKIVEELILERFNPEAMASECFSLLSNSVASSRMRDRFESILSELRNKGPSDRVAEILFEYRSEGGTR